MDNIMTILGRCLNIKTTFDNMFFDHDPKYGK